MTGIDGGWGSPLVVAVCGYLSGCWLAATVSAPLPVAFTLAALAVAATLGHRGGVLRVGVVWVVLGFGLAAAAHSRVAAATASERVPLSVEGVVGSDLEAGAQVVRIPGGRIRVLGLGAPLPLGAHVAVRGTARPPPHDAGRARRLHYARVVGDVVGARVETLRGPPLLLAGANAVRSRLHDRVVRALGPERGGLLLGLLVGDDSSLSPETVEQFRRGGLSHLLVVSGSNLAFVLAAVGVALGRFPIGRRPRLAAAAAVVVFYVLVARPEPSVLRAAAMAATAFAVAWAGEIRDPVRGFAAALLGLAVIDPFLAASIGFQLSAAATAGILLLAAPIGMRLERAAVPRVIAVAVGVSTAAQIAVAPLLVWHFGRLSAVGLAANLVAVPLAGGLTVAGAALAPVAWWWPSAFGVLGLPVEVLQRVGAVAAAMPGAEMAVSRTTMAVVVSALGTMVVLLRAVRRRAAPQRTGLGLVIVIVLVTVALWLRPSVRGPCPGVSFVDVGQGDATLLVGSDGATILVDAGRSTTDIERGLAALGADRVDVLVLTHGDSDHVGGVPAILSRYRPGLVVEPEGITWPSRTSRTVRDRLEASGVQVRLVKKGDVVRAGALRLDVVHPEAGAVAERANDVAVVGVAEVGGLRVLLPSDASASVQRGVLGAVGDVDVVKVPHHGSRDQEPALAAEARAEVAVVPVGDNPYGHPTPEALSLYGGAGTRELRTDEAGTVEVCSDERARRYDVATAR